MKALYLTSLQVLLRLRKNVSIQKQAGKSHKLNPIKLNVWRTREEVKVPARTTKLTEPKLWVDTSYGDVNGKVYTYIVNMPTNSTVRCGQQWLTNSRSTINIGAQEGRLLMRRKTLWNRNLPNDLEWRSAFAAALVERAMAPRSCFSAWAFDLSSGLLQACKQSFIFITRLDGFNVQVAILSGHFG